MVENYVIAGVVVAIFVVRELTFWYRERTWNLERESLRKEFRLKEDKLWNRIFSENNYNYAVLNDQSAKMENAAFGQEKKPIEHNQKLVDNLLEKAGLRSDGFSKDGVDVV